MTEESQSQPYEETLASATKRIRDDIQTCYNLVMLCRSKSLVSEQLEILKQVEMINEKIGRYLTYIQTQTWDKE